MSKPSSTSPGCSGLIIFLYLCYIFTSYVWSISSSATIDCKKIKHEYVNCQLKRNYLFGLWNDSIPELRLLGTDVETIDHEGAEFKTLYLKTDKGRIKFHQYGLNETTDVAEINVLLNDPSKSSLQISRARNLLYEPCFTLLILSLFISIISVFLSILKLVFNWLIKFLIKRIKC